MAGKSTIEWTQVTWNPVTGCTKISAGCKNCYAERMAKRLHLMGSKHYINEFAVTLHEDLRDMNWIIVGGESGPGARPIHQEWVESLQKQALKHDIPFFFKQWGGTNKKKSGKLLNGKVFQESPAFAAIGT